MLYLPTHYMCLVRLNVRECSDVQQDAPAGTAQPRTAAAQSHAMQIDVAVPSPQPPLQTQPQFRSSLETAALTSSASVRDKVKQQGSAAVTGGSESEGLHQAVVQFVKCEVRFTGVYVAPCHIIQYCWKAHVESSVCFFLCLKLLVCNILQ